MPLKFYFEYKPTSGELLNDLCIESGETFRSVRTSSHLGSGFKNDWLTDEICDRIGKALCEKRETWGQFVEA